MDDFFRPKFLSQEKRVLSIKKINIKERPDIKKYLTNFFENPNNFFFDKFKTQKVILGKQKLEGQKFEVPTPKNLHRKLLKRRPTMRLQQSSFLSESKILSRETSYIRGDKRRGFKDIMDIIQNNNGKKYISDGEIEEIFNAFKQVQELNKNRGKDFITTKEFTDNNYINYIDENFIKNNNNNNYNSIIKNASRKTSNEILLNAINTKRNSRLALSENKDKEIQSQKNYNNIHSQSTSINNINDDVFNSIDHSTAKTTKRFMKTSQSFFNKNNKNIIKRNLDKNEANIIFEKQNQFLSSINCDIGKKEMAKKLASQEKILLCKSKSQSQITELYNFLAKKAKKKPADLLLETIEDYREFKDLKLKINDLIKKRNPYQNYKWSDDLRITSPRNKSEPENKQSDEIVINNKNKTLTNFFKGKNEYLKRKISKARYKALMNNIIKTKENLSGLEIKGKSLLKCEYDRIKKLKGKKVIINFYNKFVNPLELSKDTYASDFNFHVHVK